MSAGVPAPGSTDTWAARPGTGYDWGAVGTKAKSTATYCREGPSTGQVDEKFGTGGTRPVRTGPWVTTRWPDVSPPLPSSSPWAITRGSSGSGAAATGAALLGGAVRGTVVAGMSVAAA